MTQSNKFYSSVAKVGYQICWTGYEDGKKIIAKEPIDTKVYVGNSKHDIILDLEKGNYQVHSFSSSWDAKKFAEASHLPVYGAPNDEVEFIVNKFENKELEFNPNKFQVAYFDIETDVNENRDFPNTTEKDSEGELTFACHEAINAITLTVPNYRFNNVMRTFTFTTFNYTGILNKDEDYTIKSYDSEKEMLMAFVHFMKQERFDFLIGFNSLLFDIPFIVGRILRVLGESAANSLSPFGKITKRPVNIYGKDYLTYNIIGLPNIDYMDVFKKFNFGSRASFSLDSICQDELNWTKIPNPSRDFRAFYMGTYDVINKPDENAHPALKLSHERYLMKKSGIDLDSNEYKKINAKTIQEAHNLFIEYNIRDVILMVRLEAKKKFFNLMGIIAYIMRTNLNDVLKTIAPWENKVYSFLMAQNKVTPKIRKKNDREPFPGGYVKATLPGYHEWILTFDYQSLYPSIMMALGISPEKYRGQLPDEILNQVEGSSIEMRTVPNDYIIENNLSMGANGALFERGEDGFLVSIIRGLFKERKATKSHMLSLKSEVEDFQVDTKDLTLDEVIKEMRRRGLQVE